MDITPLIPDDYNGKVVTLTCPQCDTRFSVTQDYHIEHTVVLCHACSILFNQETESDTAFRILAEWNNKRPKGYRLFHRKEIDTPKGKAWMVFLRKNLGGGHYEVVCDLMIDTSSVSPNTYLSLTNFRKPYII